MIVYLGCVLEAWYKRVFLNECYNELSWNGGWKKSFWDLINIGWIEMRDGIKNSSKLIETGREYN